ncbi:MAG: hypothetical protein JWR26_944 [Pedosphaera sp.]|nr:hypothetical protein [Pedosphaera sp.]
MIIWFKKISLFLGIGSFVLTRAWAAPAQSQPAQSQSDAGAIQAIQQAPDPSAAVAAYANGVAIDRGDPNLYEAYISRMIDLGLPEMAYHQAETLSTLESDNGIAWGVLAYIDARRGNLTDAASNIILAGQFAPDNAFVQRTGGEIVAWYDLKADKTSVPDNIKNGLAMIRANLGTTGAYTLAYNTATKAYQAQASVNQQSAQVAPVPAQNQSQYYPSQSQYPDTTASAYATAPNYYPDYSAQPSAYYPDYNYDWGPGWVEPSPWAWWYPSGFWGGFDFFPFGFGFAFDNRDFFDHRHNRFHDRDDRFNRHDRDRDGRFFHNDRDRNFAHNDRGDRSFQHGNNQRVGHQNGDFFGTRTHPSMAMMGNRSANGFRNGGMGTTSGFGDHRAFNSTIRSPGFRQGSTTTHFNSGFSRSPAFNSHNSGGRVPMGGFSRGGGQGGGFHGGGMHAGGGGMHGGGGGMRGGGGGMRAGGGGGHGGGGGGHGGGGGGGHGR